MNLADYRHQFAELPQIHYVGSNDKVIPPQLIKNFVGKNSKVIMVHGATHNAGWKSIYQVIQQEN